MFARVVPKGYANYDNLLKFRRARSFAGSRRAKKTAFVTSLPWRPVSPRR
jgi:hypothetical protein